MHRPHRMRRTVRRYSRSPLVRATLGAVALAIAVAITLVATDAAAALPAYLAERSDGGVGAFWAVVALGIGAAFATTAVLVLRDLERR